MGQISAALLAALEACEPFARALVAARRAGLDASAQVASLAQVYDLRITAPTLPTPADAQLAVHLAMLIGDVTLGGEPRSVVECYLQASRQERALARTG